MEKILITGASGLVGSYFCRRLSGYDTFLLNHTGASSNRVFAADLREEIFPCVLEKVKPDIIVHLAASTNVDSCEANREEADKINHLPLKHLANYLEKNPSCFLLYVSTDYVFDGMIGSYKETDATNPVNWYGTTKLLGEKELLQSDAKNWCIARTSTPFGKHNKKESFPFFIIKNLLAGKEIVVVKDQITSPTYAGNLSAMMHEIVEKKITGIIHTADDSKMSRYDQAMEVACAFKLDQELIKPTTMKDIQWKAQRPADSSLNISKAATMLENKPIKYSEGLMRMAAELELGFSKD